MQEKNSPEHACEEGIGLSGKRMMSECPHHERLESWDLPCYPNGRIDGYNSPTQSSSISGVQ